jgi:RNA polymerase sigma-70 factor (ECF subfamily)
MNQNQNRTDYRQMEDNELIPLCIAGNAGAFEAVYHRYRTRLYSVACRMHGNPGDAEDSLQDAFVSAFQNLHRFDYRSRLSTWLYRVLVNACMTRIRRTDRLERVDDLDEYPHPQNETDSDAALAGMLEQAIAQLPFMQRAVFVLHATNGLTHDEIAEILHIRPGTSKSAYSRARSTLREELVRKGITSSGA